MGGGGGSGGGDATATAPAASASQRQRVQPIEAQLGEVGHHLGRNITCVREAEAGVA